MPPEVLRGAQHVLRRKGLRRLEEGLPRHALHDERARAAAHLLLQLRAVPAQQYCRAVRVLPLALRAALRPGGACVHNKVMRSSHGRA